MIVATCQHENRRTNGTTKAGAARYRCKDCGKSWTESTDLFGGMRIGMDRACQIIELICEGMSIRAVERITDTCKTTILELLTLVGEKCAAMEAERIRDIHVGDVQCDEIWQYIYCKAATATRKGYAGEVGDSWCWTAIERNTKLMVAWHHGMRSIEDNHAFMRKLARATTGRFHLSSDGYGTYEQAVTWNLGQRVDYGQVVKIFAEGTKEERRKYSPSRIIGCSKRVVLGEPEFKQTSTSHVERMNGSIRNFMKRMVRCTYAFSKKWDNHRAALALFFAHYNWCRKHRSLRGKTPAMATGLAGHAWTVRELIENALHT